MAPKCPRLLLSPDSRQGTRARVQPSLWGGSRSKCRFWCSDHLRSAWRARQRTRSLSRLWRRCTCPGTAACWPTSVNANGCDRLRCSAVSAHKNDARELTHRMCHAVSPRRSRVSVYADSRGGTKSERALRYSRNGRHARRISRRCDDRDRRRSVEFYLYFIS